MEREGFCRGGEGTREGGVEGGERRQREEEEKGGEYVEGRAVEESRGGGREEEVGVEGEVGEGRWWRRERGRGGGRVYRRGFRVCMEREKNK